MIEWLTSFDEDKLQEIINKKAIIKTFFQETKLNPNVLLIKGMICSYRIEEIDNPLIRQGRYLDKLVDEFAKG